MSNSNPALSLMLCMNFSRLERWRPKSANIEKRKRNVENDKNAERGNTPAPRGKKSILVSPEGWRWQRLSDYTAQLKASDYVQLKWPKGEKEVYVHIVTTRVRKLYLCQVVIVRQSLDAPLSQARYWASSDLEASPEMLLSHIAARWDIEVLFGDGKEELGLDQYQLMSATAIVRFWTLVMLAYAFLEEERDRLQVHWQRHVTIGEARREIQRRHRRHLLDWLHGQFQSGVEPDTLYELLSA